MKKLSDEMKEHCPRRLMGEYQPKHMPCDTGDFSKDGVPMTRFTPERIAELRALNDKRSMDGLVSSDFAEHVADCERSYYLAAGHVLPSVLDELMKLRKALSRMRCACDHMPVYNTTEHRSYCPLQIAREARK